VGRLVAELKAQGVYEQTLIVFIGDNGYFHGDRGLADKWYPYEQALRVPLIVRDPRLPSSRRGGTRDQLALNIDVAPTILSAVGLHPDFPADKVMQGRDLSQLYTADVAPAWRDEFFYEHPTITSRDRIPASQGVIRRDWKYVHFPEFDYEQLFNLIEDPEELHNLAGVAAHATPQATMRQKLRDWQQRAR
jgi:arylsulfatase